MDEAVEDPYAPPQSAIGSLGNKGDPGSYWIEGRRLFVTDGANLPDVCLITGKVGGEIMRLHRIIRWQPDHTFLYLSIILFVGVGFLKILALPFLVVIAGMILRRLWKSVSISYGLAGKAFKKQKLFGIAGWGMVGGALAFMVLTPFDPEARLTFGGIVALLGLFLLRRLDQSFRVVEIKKRVAILSGIHPGALIYLEEWRRSHLSKFLPPEVQELHPHEGANAAGPAAITMTGPQTR
ncbi:hypothetical protein OAL23_00990 [bacterium]|nr:hypothetical protein [bacterium]